MCKYTLDALELLTFWYNNRIQYYHRTAAETMFFSTLLSINYLPHSDSRLAGHNGASKVYWYSARVSVFPIGRVSGPTRK